MTTLTHTFQTQTSTRLPPLYKGLTIPGPRPPDSTQRLTSREDKTSHVRAPLLDVSRAPREEINRSLSITAEKE